MREMRKASFSRLLRAIALVVTTALGSASTAYASGNNCSFQARGLTLNFGTLNPASLLDARAPISASALNADKAGDCAPVQTMQITINGGTTRYLKNGAGDLISYTLVGFVTNPSGQSNGNYVNFLAPTGAFGNIAWSDYANAPAGNDYADMVTITVSP